MTKKHLNLPTWTSQKYWVCALLSIYPQSLETNYQAQTQVELEKRRLQDSDVFLRNYPHDNIFWSYVCRNYERIILKRWYITDDLPSGFQGAYWLPQAKAYAVLGGGGPGIDPCDLARAFTIPLEGIIVICPKYLFKTLLIKPLIPIQQTLQPYKANPKKIKQGDRLDSYYSISSVLLHEMTHMMNLEGEFRITLPY